MKKKSKLNHRKSTIREAGSGLLFIVLAASAVSLLSFLYYFQRGEVLLYGDAVAHINIARRVFDSQTPGLLQLGTVWLPLPHLLMLPFLVSDWLWRTGVGGSIPSMVAYVFSVAGIFQCTRGVLQAADRTRSAARAGAWIAALTFGANPNLIYLQTTAMTETLYLALFVWAVVYISEWMQKTVATEVTGQDGGIQRPLWKCALCLAGAELTRYDGWFLAAGVGALVTVMALRRWSDQKFRWTAVKFLLSIATCPALWLAYNAAVYRDPLEFARGPYSAKAIEMRTAKPGYPAHPGSGNVFIAGSFFLKSAELNMAAGNWGRIWVLIMLLGVTLAVKGTDAQRSSITLLAIPLIFYSLSIAHGGVPLFVPTWWPFTWYNIRYGLQLIPLFAVSLALVVAIVYRRWQLAASRTPGASRFVALLQRASSRVPPAITISAALAFVVVTYFFVWRSQPLCFTEAWVNSRTKLALESSVARMISTFPPTSQYLMSIGDHVGAFQQAGIPLRHVINEGNHRPWIKPADPDGLWERALADPGKYVDFVIVYDGDAVDQNADKNDLTLLSEIHATGQPHARIYGVKRALNQSR